MVVLVLFAAFLVVIPGIGYALVMLRDYFRGADERTKLIQP
jgi:hypothetical protein